MNQDDLLYLQNILDAVERVEMYVLKTQVTKIVAEIRAEQGKDTEDTSS